MAEALWLLVKADVGTANKRTVNGITAALINADDAQTEAQVKAACVARLVAAGHPVGGDYFSSAALVSVAAQLGDNLDMFYFGNCATTKIEGP